LFAIKTTWNKMQK